jgi:ornithine cyclodeaminase
MKYLSANDVRLALPMRNCIELMRIAFSQWSSGKSVVPHRISTDTQRGTTLVMPAYVPDNGDLTVKMVSVYPDNTSQNMPVINGLVVVLDDQTGMPSVIMDGGSLTAIRTGAAGGLAADLLARKDAANVALFGAGVQARTQLEAAMAVRRIEQVFLKSRTRANAEKLATEIATWPDAPAVDIVDDPHDAVPNADLVIAATTSTSTVFDGSDLQPGTHVTAVGSFKPEVQEVDEETVHRSRLFVDSRAAAFSEAGELINAGITHADEIGEVINGDVSGRREPEDITFFKSVGIGVQDAVAAGAAAKQAVRLEIGQLLKL